MLRYIKDKVGEGGELGEKILENDGEYNINMGVVLTFRSKPFKPQKRYRFYIKRFLLMGNGVNVVMKRWVGGSWEEILKVSEDYIDGQKWGWDFERYFSFEVEGVTDSSGKMDLVRLEVTLMTGVSAGKLYFRAWGSAVEV